MAKNNANIQVATEKDPNLLRMLDRGIDDVQAGRVLSHREAMAEVGRIREARRSALAVCACLRRMHGQFFAKAHGPVAVFEIVVIYAGKALDGRIAAMVVGEQQTLV